jgi:hypothetical protein
VRSGPARRRGQRSWGGKRGLLEALWSRSSSGFAILAAAVLFLRPQPQALDRNKVMGFPLNAQGGVASAVVEEVESAIAAALQDTDPLRWLQARLFLGGAQRGGVPADSATRMARKRGARYWLGALSPGSVIR